MVKMPIILKNAIFLGALFTVALPQLVRGQDKETSSPETSKKSAEEKSTEKPSSAKQDTRTLRLLVLENTDWYPLDFSQKQAPTMESYTAAVLGFDEARLCLSVNRFQRKPGAFDVSSLITDILACSVDFILGVNPLGGSFLFAKDSWPSGQLISISKPLPDLMQKKYQLDRLLYETHGIGGIVTKVDGQMIEAVGLADFWSQTKTFLLLTRSPAPVPDAKASITRLGFKDQNARFRIEAETLAPGYLIGTAERDQMNRPKPLIYRDLEQFIKKEEKVKF